MRPVTVTHLPTCATETAGAGGLNIAETFPEGRGSPHGCGLRAVFCRDAASARPEACRDKSKAPRSGDVAGRSPGVQGAAATGRPLCAPSAMTAITQTINRERNRPGSNIEAVALLSAARAGTFPVAPLFCRVAAGTLPGLPGPLTGSHLVGPVSAAPPGDAIRLGAALLPGGGWRLSRPTGASHRITPRRPGKRSATGRCHQTRSRFYAGWRLAPYPAYGPRHV